MGSLAENFAYIFAYISAYNIYLRVLLRPTHVGHVFFNHLLNNIIDFMDCGLGSGLRLWPRCILGPGSYVYDSAMRSEGRPRRRPRRSCISDLGCE